MTENESGTESSERGIDPRLNCAADICCPPPKARAARLKMIRGWLAKGNWAGKVSDPNGEAALTGIAESVCAGMEEHGVAFAPVQLMQNIAELADHPGRKAAG